MTPPTTLNARLENEPATTRVQSQLVSGNFFSTFGIVPALGRLLSEEDTRSLGEAPVVVLGHEFWQRQFGADPNVIGHKLPIPRGRPIRACHG